MRPDEHKYTNKIVRWEINGLLDSDFGEKSCLEGSLKEGSYFDCPHILYSPSVVGGIKKPLMLEL